MNACDNDSSTTSTSNEVGLDESSQGPPKPRGRRRLRILIQCVLVLLFVLIPAVFLLYVVDRQLSPVYDWVAGTPVERVCLRILPRLWHHKDFFARQALNQSLTPLERTRVTPILHKMALIQPSHALKLTSGENIFGRLQSVHEEGVDYAIRYFDGARYHKRLLREDEIIFRRPLVYPDESLDSRDLRFLLSYPEVNHFYLHPHLIATDRDFAKALEIHTLLAEMQDAFIIVFAPLLQVQEITRTHIVHFADPRAFAAAVEGVGEAHLINSASFFRKSSNRMFLEEPGQLGRRLHMVLNPGESPEQDRQQFWARLVRHEGAHQLAIAHGLYRQYEQVPFWLEEGLAQYCELTPFDQPHPYKLQVLRDASRQQRLIPWQDLLERYSRDEIPGDRLELAYAQSWLLFRHLMKVGLRPRFFRYLLEWSPDAAKMNPQAQQIRLMNHLGTTFTRLQVELEQELKTLVVSP